MHKQILMLCILLGTGLSAIAQTDTLIAGGESSGKKKIKLRSDMFAVDFTMDRWLETPPGVETRLWSPGISISIFRSLSLGRSPFALATGLTFSSHNVHSNATFVEVAPNGHPVMTHLSPLSGSYSKNKSSSNYIEVPLEFRIQSKNSRPLRLHLGAKGGFLVNHHTKTVDDLGKRKEFDRSNIHDYRYGVYTRIGWNYINLYGYYSLVPLIREGRGDELIPVSVGLSITI